ncbi:MAG TPA: phosphatase PAP2 family protein [Geobacteraceae bacterium]|nr:phosphatase PAP2 family protein [Geobacteraceae bacterium]
MKAFTAFLVIFMTFAGVAVAAPPADASGKHGLRVAGFLADSDLPDSIALLGAPPADGSAAAAADEEAYRATRALRGSPRWALAARDSNLDFPEAAQVFSCALNAPITQKETPHLYDLLHRTLADASRATIKAKDYYHRVRPFVVNREGSCTPSFDTKISKNGSYPSAHSTVGWVWALILAEIAPDRMNAILARGEAFGRSRVICGVHWQSDVAAGRILGAGLVARLHADPSFHAELEAARKELAAVRARNLKPLCDCTRESETLKLGKLRVP